MRELHSGRRVSIVRTVGAQLQLTGARLNTLGLRYLDDVHEGGSY